LPIFFGIWQLPREKEERPSRAEVLDFLNTAFSHDLPVAFLNLDNGTLKNLESWHWVTLVSIASDMEAQMYDQSCSEIIHLGEWLSSTTKGGAFVALEPKNSEEEKA